MRKSWYTYSTQDQAGQLVEKAGEMSEESYQAERPPSSANQQTPSSPFSALAQEILDLAAVTLPPMEVLYPKREIREQHLLEEREAALMLSLHPEVARLSREGALFAYFRFWGSDPQCQWLARYRAYCKKNKVNAAIRVKLLVDNDYRVLYETLEEFYHQYVTSDAPFSMESSAPPKPSWQESVQMPVPPPIEEDRPRTTEEWEKLRTLLGDEANLVDSIISGKTGQALLWADVVYTEITNLGKQCSPRFLQMARDTWGVVATWNQKRQEITNEYERVAFVKMVNHAIFREQRDKEREGMTQDYLQWMQKREPLDELLRARLTKNRKEPPTHERPEPKS